MATAPLTPEQETRQRLNLPFEGAQPAMVFMRVYIEDEMGGGIPQVQHDRYFACDGRYGLSATEDFARICATHATQLIDSIPDVPFLARISAVQAIDAQGRYKGADTYYEKDVIDIHTVDEYRDDTMSPQAVALAAKYPGETLEAAIMPRAPSSAFANVNFSEITVSVAKRYRDAKPQFDWSHALELRSVLKP